MLYALVFFDFNIMIVMLFLFLFLTFFRFSIYRTRNHWRFCLETIKFQLNRIHGNRELQCTLIHQRIGART